MAVFEPVLGVPLLHSHPSFAPLISPVLTGTPVSPTADAGTSTTQIATTEFVQIAVRSTPGKEASEYATIAALPAIVYANGSSGVGATLTGVAVGALGVDSQSPAVGNRILVKNQVSTFQNGIYTVTATGSGIAVFVLTRALDFNQQTDVLTGAATYVVGGTTLAGTTWDVNSADSPVMGTDAITFVQSAGPGSVVQGNGITITGTSIAINTAVTADLTSTQTMTGKTIDGVTPTVMGYVDPTSSIQTQLNSKQVSGAYLTTVDISANTNLAVSAPVVLTGDTLSIPAATASVNGYATSTQITKLDGITAGATANAKATGAELDTLTDDAKFVTAKAVADGHKVPHAAPGTSGNYMKSDGTDWTSAAIPTWNQDTTGNAGTVDTFNANATPTANNIPVLDANALLPAAALPLTGMIVPYAGSTAPTGWLLADGATVSQTTYAALFAVTGHTYGADPGGGNFILPNLKGKIPVGKSTDTEFDTLGETGGAKEITLTAAQSGLPAHKHSIAFKYNSTAFGANSIGLVSNGVDGSNDATMAENTAANASSAHTNLQPYITLNYIIKT